MNKVFFSLIIVGLVVVIFMQRCNTPKPSPPIIHTDTIVNNIVVHDTIKGDVIYTGSVDTIWEPSYLPDTGYNNLLVQYKKLGDEFFARNTSTTTYPILSYGSVTLMDTVRMNKLIGSSIITNLIIPERIIIKPAPAVRQFYIGGALIGNPKELINGAQLGLLYKDRKDRIIGIHAGYNGTVQYSISSYWKINLRHK